jgi:hypothetical protein
VLPPAAMTTWTILLHIYKKLVVNDLCMYVVCISADATLIILALVYKENCMFEAHYRSISEISIIPPYVDIKLL